MVYVSNILDGIYNGGDPYSGAVGPGSQEDAQVAISATRLEYTTVISDATGVSIGFEMPRGLGHIKDDGEMETHSVQISVYYKLSSSGTWLWAWTRTKTAATTTPQRWEELGIDGLTPGEYDIAIVNHNDSSLDSNRYFDLLVVDYINAWSHGIYDLPHTALYQYQIEQNEQTGSDRSEKSVLVEGYADCRIYTNTSTYTDGNYTNNPAWVWMAILTSDRFGFGYDYSDLDLQSFIDAASYFSTNSITWNPSLDGSMNGADLKTRYQTECLCFVSDGGGGVKITPDTTGSSTYSFDTSNIVRGSFSYSRTSIKDKVNRVIVDYADVNYNYKPQTMQRDNDGAIVDAGNHIREAKMTLIGVVDRAQAEMIADRQLAYAEYAETGCTFETGLQALAVEVGDLIDITHDLPNWTNKIFRVIQVAFNPHTNRHRIYAIEYSADIYGSHSWTAGGSSGDGEDTDPWAVASDVTALSASQDSRTDSEGNTVLQIDLSWSNPVDPDYDHCAIYVWPSNEGNWRLIGSTPDAAFTLDDVSEGVTYRFAVCSVSVDDVENAKNSSPQTSITITFAITEENLTDRGGWDRPNCFYLPDGSLQFGMLNPNHRDHYEYRIDGILQDNANQDDGIALWQITGGVPYAELWEASTPYTTTNWVIPTDQDPDSPVYFKCTTAGTSAGTEPTWDRTPGNTTNDGTVVWTCYADTDGVHSLNAEYANSGAYNNAGNACRGEGAVYVMGGTTDDWDYAWGPCPPAATTSRPFILYSKQGAPFKTFRICDDETYANAVEVEYDYVLDSGTYYGIIKRIVLDRPVLELPSGHSHAVSLSGASYTNYPEYTATIILSPSGELWTELKTSRSASTSYSSKWHAVLATLQANLGEVGDVFIARHQMLAWGAGTLKFHSGALMLTEGTPSMVCRIDTLDGAGGISERNVYHYRFSALTQAPVITNLVINGGTNYTGLQAVRVSETGGHTCVLFRSSYIDGSDYCHAYFISDDGGDLNHVKTLSNTGSSPREGIELSYLSYTENARDYRLPCLITHDGTSIKGYTGRATAFVSIGGQIMSFSAPDTTKSGLKACTDGDYNYVMNGHGKYLSVCFKGENNNPTTTDFSAQFTGTWLAPYIYHYDAARIRSGPDRSLTYVCTNYDTSTTSRRLATFTFADADTASPTLTLTGYHTGYSMGSTGPKFSVLGGSVSETFVELPDTSTNKKWFIFRVYAGDEASFRTHTTSHQHRPRYGVIPSTSWQLYSIRRGTLRKVLLDTITDAEIQRNTVDVAFKGYVTKKPGATAGNMSVFDTIGDLIDSGYAVIDEDDMASDSATKVPTQQSVKAYTDGLLNAIKGGTWATISTAQACASGTTVIAYDTSVEDTFSEFNAGTYTWTAARNGRVRVTASVRGTVTTAGNVALLVRKNGAAVVGNVQGAFAGVGLTLFVTYETSVSSGDTIQAVVTQSTGSNYTLHNNTAYNFLQVMWEA